MCYATTLALCLAMPFAALADPLPSWNPTASEVAIVDFMGRVMAADWSLVWTGAA